MANDAHAVALVVGAGLSAFLALCGWHIATGDTIGFLAALIGFAGMWLAGDSQFNARPSHYGFALVLTWASALASAICAVI